MRVLTSLRVQKKAVHGANIALLHELCLKDPSTFNNFVRIDQQCCVELLSL